jgi:hypothetical protein
MRPFKKKKSFLDIFPPQGRLLFRRLISQFQHLSVKVVCQSIVVEVLKTLKEAKVLFVSTFPYKITTQS